MIISHKYKFIFLHVPKTGGSSINAYFSQFIGKKDILNGWNHSLRLGIPYNQKLLKMINNKYGLSMISKAIKLRMNDNKMFERPILEYAFREILKKKIGTTSMHANAEQIKKYNPHAWNNYFKFTFVRNPYTHAVSDWMFDEKNWSIISENTYINEKKFTKKNFIVYLKKIKKQIKNKKNYYHEMLPFNKIYTINGKIAVDFVGKFENLKRDINKIHKKLRLPKKRFYFPHTKKNKKTDYLEYYNQESKKLVEEIWSKEFEFFKYKFLK